jgi:hypothetical protein
MTLLLKAVILTGQLEFLSRVRTWTRYACFIVVICSANRALGALGALGANGKNGRGAGEACVTDLVQFMQWTPAFHEIFGYANDARSKSERQMQMPIDHKMVEFALGYCELEADPKSRVELRERFEFRSLEGQLQVGIRAWHLHPANRFIEYSLSVAMMEMRPGARNLLAPMVARIFLNFLREHGETAIAASQIDVNLRIKLSEILSRQFTSVIATAGFDRNRAQVISSATLGHRLAITTWPVPSELLFVLFHELGHASAERWRVDTQFKAKPEPQHWIELGVFEEFRARILTEIFVSEWNRRFKQYGPARQPAGAQEQASVDRELRGLVLNLPLTQIFVNLRHDLRPINPEQSTAYAKFFEEWDKLTLDQQEQYLKAQVN